MSLHQGMTFASARKTTVSNAAHSKWKIASLSLRAKILTKRSRRKLAKWGDSSTFKKKHLTVSQLRQNVQSVKSVRIKFEWKMDLLMAFRIYRNQRFLCTRSSRLADFEKKNLPLRLFYFELIADRCDREHFVYKVIFYNIGRSDLVHRKLNKIQK